VGGVAFKKRSASWVVAMPSHFPHASRPSAFRAPGWGAPAPPCSCCRWRSAALWRSAPFSHRSASRIFVVQPGCVLPPMGSLVERSGPGCGLCPALSFKDLRHPCWGGGRAESELYLPYGPTGHLLLQPSWERALTGLAEGADFDNAWPSGHKRCQLQHTWFAGSGTASGATSHRWAECGYLPAVQAATAPRTLGDRPRRRALLGRRLCSWAVLPLLQHDAFVRGSVLACPGGLEWGSADGQVAGEVLVADEIAAAICALGLRLFGFDSLSSPLEWRRGRGPCRSYVCPEVIVAAVWPPGAVVAVAGTEPESRL
jgi:hypothetical protein